MVTPTDRATSYSVHGGSSAMLTIPPSLNLRAQVRMSAQHLALVREAKGLRRVHFILVMIDLGQRWRLYQ